ncbi:sensor histidine kinase [Halorubrum sp. Atlit-8R]|uniref:receiver/sensor box histidine kinase n=1 Tax=unclassified Halorubrum TaxID=2642239 RepID=UPI000EF19D00|nr:MULTISPECIES: HAMP domain-containing sensor histidine kinase [unclassified Halorubrum]RLM72239.1 sensor histidine kinase [Halorubrum sp. Atlit-9R]RLM72284.1 sensor histidine kinase [Halorubrum sp. Atlit-9R]RLM83318.1 sensor histidine kinase [Halorubrum sp. Atlit-8R]
MSTQRSSIAAVLVAGAPDRAEELRASLERADDRLAVEPVATVDAALELVGDSPVDCVVAVGRPAEPTGIPAVETVRDRRPALPIVFCPAESLDASAVAEAFDAGATDVARGCADPGRTPVLARRIANAVASARALEEAERQRDRLESLVHGVSHDLRNPLNVAQGRLDLARSEGDLAHVDAAASAVDRTLELIADLLTLAKQGEQPGELEPVDLSAVARECWANVATGDATLVVDADRQILAERGRLKRLLENLFRNSVEHGSTGSRPKPDDSVEHGSTGGRTASGDAADRGGDVTVVVGDISPMYTTTRAAAVLPSGFFVEDDGPGIPESERDRVFEVGYTTDPDGTGFGLSIVTEVASAHGWEVAVAEGSRGGARFEVTGVEEVD